MNDVVFASLLPVVLLIGLGYGVGRMGWVHAEAVKDLSNLVFLVLTPALLFRTMSVVHVQDLHLGAVGIYFVAAGVVFFGTLVMAGWHRLTAVRALAHMFSNTLMIGVPLVGLVFGEEGLVTLVTLVSVHSLILLTGATVVLESITAHENARHAPAASPPMYRTVLSAVRNGILHPVPLPILVGLAFAQTGWVIPEVLDKPLQLLGQALGPMALLLVGVTLAHATVGRYVVPALRIAVVKNVVHPAVLAAMAWMLGLSGLPVMVMIVAAALPVGANVFLFGQRYEVGQEEVTAGVAVSTAMGLFTVPLVIVVVTKFF